MKSFKIPLFSLIFLSLGIFLGYSGAKYTSEEPGVFKETHRGQNRLTNKLLDFEIPPSKELGDLKDRLEKKIEASIKEGKTISVGLYFRDLTTGPWIGINESEKFIPASLLKVPIMMTYFKQAEKDSTLFSKKLKYDLSYKVSGATNYPKKIELKEGDEYAIDELIRRMIVYSDNDAMNLLSKNLDFVELKKLYKELGINISGKTDAADFITPRNIGSFFRVLYNATYLNEEMSEKALKLLTETDFDLGIVAGVPKDTLVAQKYGERTMLNMIELHDCGIVYYPEHPYIICIMTKGKDFNSLASIIKEISQLTYEQVKEAN